MERINFQSKESADTTSFLLLSNSDPWNGSFGKLQFDKSTTFVRQS